MIKTITLCQQDHIQSPIITTIIIQRLFGNTTFLSYHHIDSENQITKISMQSDHTKFI